MGTSMIKTLVFVPGSAVNTVHVFMSTCWTLDVGNGVQKGKVVVTVFTANPGSCGSRLCPRENDSGRFGDIDVRMSSGG